MSAFVVAASYRFVNIAEPKQLRGVLLKRSTELHLCGTILLAHEGINLTVAGRDLDIAAFRTALEELPGFAAMTWKISTCASAPFRRLRIKCKPEIVTMGVQDLPIAGHTGTYVQPEAWDALIARDNVVVIDTRNTYELAAGTFSSAINPGIAHFRQFPEWIERQKLSPNQPVALFCTGGIRCEKATALLRQRGFTAVYHLAGGILDYLDKTANRSGAWQGTCFVFDERESVDEDLQPASLTELPAASTPESSPNHGR